MRFASPDAGGHFLGRCQQCPGPGTRPNPAQRPEEQPSARKATLEKITEINQTLQGNLDDYERTIIADDDRALFNTFLQMSERYHGLQKSIRDAVAAEQLDEARRLINGPLAEYADSMMKALAALIEYNAKGAEQASQRSSAVFEEAFSLIVVALVMILVALIAIATLLTRSIVLPWPMPWPWPSAWPPAT